MDEFERYFNDEFFIIDSNNLNSVKQNFYGFTIQGDTIIQKENIEQIDINSNFNGFGAYIYVKVNEENITLLQDYVGTYGLYLYEMEGYFAISNSFLKLVEYLKNFKYISFNKKFAESFMFTPMTSLAYDQTLVNEIKLIPRDYEIIINKKDKSISYNFVDYSEESILLDSEEGVQFLDDWYWKWVNIIRLLKSKTNYIEMDLSGGFDTRVVAALWLTANIDFDKIIVHSYTKDNRQEDFNIASKIAKKFNFKLNNFDLRPDKIYFEDINTTLKISFYIKGGFHKEMYFKNVANEETIYNFSGSSGGTIRSLYNNTPEEYTKNTLNYINKFSKEMEPSTEDMINYSFEKIKNRYNISDENIRDLPEKIYKENNNRHHFGKDLVENYFSNVIKIGPLMDCDLNKLIITSDKCNDRDLLMALIFERYCPELLEFEIEGNRKIDKKTLDYAKQLNEKYPFITKDLEFISGPEIYKKDKNIAPKNRVKNDDPVDFLKEIFFSRFFEMEFKKYYSNETYQTIYSSIMNTGKFSHPLRHAYSAIMALKIIHDTRYKSINNFSFRDWFNSFLNDEKIEEVPLNILNLLTKFHTARIDLKNFGSESNSIVIMDNSDVHSKEYSPNWFKTEQGKGLLIESVKGSIDLKVKCINDGLLKIYLRGLDVRDKNKKRIPIYIDYIKLSINGDLIIQDNKLTWHDHPYIFKKEVKNSEIIDIHIEWLPFNSSSDYTFNEWD